jgi:hypothetical protein
MDRATKSTIIKKRKALNQYKYSRSNLAHAKYIKDRHFSIQWSLFPTGVSVIISSSLVKTRSNKFEF